MAWAESWADLGGSNVIRLLPSCRSRLAILRLRLLPTMSDSSRSCGSRIHEIGSPLERAEVVAVGGPVQADCFVAA